MTAARCTLEVSCVARRAADFSLLLYYTNIYFLAVCLLQKSWYSIRAAEWWRDVSNVDTLLLFCAVILIVCNLIFGDLC